MTRYAAMTALAFAASLSMGCATADRDALYQPIEPNFADAGDPIQRQLEDEQTLDARGRVEAPIQAQRDAADPPGDDIDDE